MLSTSVLFTILVQTASAGFSSECSDIALNTNWLTADCPNDAGTSISSAVYLPSWIENNQGSLTWLKDGAFSNSCDDCLLLDDSSTLQCYCEGTYVYQSGNSTLDLEQHIANYDGHLLSNLTGTPVVPSDSSIAVPSTIALTILFDIQDDTCTKSDSFEWEFAGPETCWSLTLAAYPEEFQSVASAVNEGWAVEIYNDSDCSGTVFGTLDLDNLNDCVAVDGASYVKTTPLFNWD